jgi:maleamate amidohydrolase
MAVWDRFITERDRQVFAKAGYGARGGFGRRPAVVVVDVNYAFCGERPLPILESIERYHNSCGQEAWEAVARIQELLGAARAKGVPVFFSTGARPAAGLFGRGRWANKNRRTVEDVDDRRANEIVAPLAPQPGEIVIEKDKPSVFFGTGLASYLVDLGVDTLLVCGTTTSGCVRATVVDAFSLNYRVTVVEDATFDRGQASHAINLFDMSQKYADVVPTREVNAYLARLPDHVFDVDLRELASASPGIESGAAGGARP